MDYGSSILFKNVDQNENKSKLAKMDQIGTY